MKTEKRIDELLEACDACSAEQDNNHEDGHARMAKSDLFNIADNAKALHDMLDDNYPLDDWAKAKLTKASDYVKAVLQHIKYEVEQEGEQPEGQEHTKIYIATDPRTLGM
jgi:hypothetical protein